MKNENVQKAVAILEEAKDYALEELKSEAMLGLRVANTMQTLINGLKHVGGFAGEVTGTVDSTNSVQPAKTFMGLDLGELEKEQVPAKVDVPTDEKEAFKQKVTELHAGFFGRDEKELQEALTREELLGVAKLSGITVPDPTKQNVTLKLIREIKEAMEDKAKLDEEKAAKIRELENQGSEDSEGEGSEGNDIPNAGDGANENQS
ncbi:hypothetical protein FNJ88_11085 [Chryseobacterium sp. SNU WT5]|uniref:hypothetical protein n=1 Tax=Chryseobacterium sp. SNU WT5 TaxID=2594269 RepID=UPI00117F330D|nr:hypothetical protein [Chryseobacterium sp. SNU WT5]QDP86063.1 hypothetical protein FNJ88_11085 [Chryseobacterium sp. SNU WT5]